MSRFVIADAVRPEVATIFRRVRPCADCGRPVGYVRMKRRHLGKAVVCGDCARGRLRCQRVGPGS